MKDYGKIYVAFDGDNDIEYYNRLKEFKNQNGETYEFFDGYEFYPLLDKVNDDDLKQQVLQKVSQADIVIVLMGPTTKSMRRYIRWQVEGAINLGKPIIVVNENNIRAVDFDKCPALIKKALTLHISFNEVILECALENWPSMHQGYVAKEKKGMFKFPTEVYTHLGLETPALE